MMELIWVSMVFSFITSFILVKKMIPFFEKAGIVGIDVHKKHKPKIAEMGGVPVVSGFLLSIFIFIGASIFLYKKSDGIIDILAAVNSIMIVAIIGIFDDISVLFKFKGKEGVKRTGLKQWQKPILTLIAAIPLMVIMAGNSEITLPFIGNLDLGVIYPLIMVPIGIVGASNAINMLAGLNGLEAGMGSILLIGMGIHSLQIGNSVVALISLCFASSLLAFLIFNWYPAKIFPGDSLTYSIGITVATTAILGNMEKFAVIAFMPWFIELVLKARYKFKAESFGEVQEDGTLKPPKGKIHSLTHVVMKIGKFKEWQITLILMLTELLFVTMAFYL